MRATRSRTGPILIGVVATSLCLLASLFIQVGENMENPRISRPTRRAAIDLSGYPSTPPPTGLGLVFLHHSIGEQWLADPAAGATSGHPNGGGLRQALERNGYRVHDATYGSRLGERTDLFDWLPKFGAQMEDVLRVKHQDESLPSGEHNQIVMFKSCYPNGYFAGQGAEPGKSLGPELTVANAKAAFRALLPVFEKRPEVLFVFVTTPPFNGSVPKQRLAKVLLKIALGRPSTAAHLRQQAELSREFHDWIVAQDGWLADYLAKNVVIFDYYDLLTLNGGSLFLEYPSGPGDSHPSSQANQLATVSFVQFLNQAVHRL